MGKDTKIAWCDDTFNPFIGCTEVSTGCDSCYARILDARHKWGGETHWGPGVPRMRTSASNWDQPHKWNRQAEISGKRRFVFCASLADVFDNEVPNAWRTDLWALIQETPYLTWLLLTKRIGNAAKMVPPHWLTAVRANVWIGASVVNQEEADRDIPKLLATPAAKRFISYEPVLGAVKLDPEWILPWHAVPAPKINWVIIGAESGSRRRTMDMAHARAVIAQCKAAGVPVFVKQDGGSFPGNQGRFTDEEFALKERPE